MNSFEQLLILSDKEKKEKGVEYTPKEINQQPAMWKKTVDILGNRKDEIHDFFIKSGLIQSKEVILILTGAGSSEFIGNSIKNVLRKRLKREVLSIPTTYFVTSSVSMFVPHFKYVVISFSRSGNSPESLATYNNIKKIAPEVKQIIVTCNNEGDLAKKARNDKQSLCIILPEETNDLSLAMTSSFSAMALTGIGLCFMESLDKFYSIVERIAYGADRIIKDYGDLLVRFASKPFSRACFLGSHSLMGTMQECSLKMQEMTEGKVASIFSSYLGLRHGPQVFIDNNCVVIAALSSDKLVRKYEIDLLSELKKKDQGSATLVICDKTSEKINSLSTDIIEIFPDGCSIEDDFRIMTDVVVGQILATFKSIDLGLKPDNPSPIGTINRVVQGVKIYDL